VEEIVMSIKRQGAPAYVEDILVDPDEEKEGAEGAGDGGDGLDALFEEAVAIVLADGKASTSYIQRKMKIGYNRAARIIDQMEEQGVVSKADHTGKREILGR
jgi:S-DNA-T family DNA segregation ATPase FtsK/SpoIIIE